ncbi:iron complex outermembrane recepter protein [Sphingomonas jatrophae]|uniref:Iron complex outermembrane recepter protein n=2 Tax=Sphingomonas jatrophae TaxID=1166337 RepID=A0A1I6M9Y0_9SPHN|nr:iron complex outermembrane recepter protein [Sphingomonas jatrophae]
MIATLALLAGGSAQAAEAVPDGASEVIVTARQRAEDAQRVPAALSVVGGELLDRSYTVNPQALAQLVPALNYSSANPRNTAITLRGLGSSVVAVSQSNDGLEPGVGFYVDQVYHARPATAAFDFTDIERIEVLRGPQGTLFGKNSTAGAVSITSRLPTFQPESQAEISVGSYDFLQVKGAVSGPLVDDRLAIRLSALSTMRDGVIRNVRLNRRHNGIDNQAIRGQLLWTPTETLTARLIADYTRFDSECCTQVFYRVGTSLRPAARQYPALAAGIGYRPASTDPYDRLTDIDAPVGSDTNEGGVSAIVEMDLGTATLTSVSAWRFWNWSAQNDRDYTGVPIQLVQGIPSRQDQYSQEVRLASQGERRLGYVAGLYFFRQTIVGRPVSIYGPAAAYWLIGATTGANGTAVTANLLDGYGQDGRTRFASNSYAAFAELNWRVFDRVTLTGGLRYTYEQKRGDYATTVSGGLVTSDPALTAAKLSVLRPQSYSARDRDGSVSGRANIAWQVSDRILAYAGAARGFKSGGINMSGLPLDASNRPVLATAVVAPERNTTWEAGVKTRLLGDRLLLNLAAFHTRVKDFQATIVDSSQTVALRGYLSNIPEVTVKGVEGDAVARIAPGLSLRASFAYAHGTYSDYPRGPCPLERQGSATSACDLTGGRLSGLPRWSETLGVDHAVPLAPLDGDLVLHADAGWRSGYNGEAALSRFTRIGGYSLVNASLGYRSNKGWEVALFARNLFDRTYIQNVTVQAGNSGLILATPGDPRLIGATLRVRR